MSTSASDEGTTRLATGSDGAQADPAHPAAEGGSKALREGERLFEYEIVRVIGIGGFGIVYLAHDHALQRDVAVKEYMPASLAERAGATRVSIKSRRHAESFEAGLRSFINEARLLAQFDHPSLVKVYRFWEANGTAYMVMPFYEGGTLKQNLAQCAEAPDEQWLRDLLAPLLDALDTLHQQQCFHRDISPDNILMLQDGRPLLLDFGAARRAISGADQNFTVILKPCYAPIEQYTDDATMRQGPWTDLYALASVVHFAIMGRAPLPSVSRVVNDPQAPLVQAAAGRYSEPFLRAMDHCLAVLPQDRPQSVSALRALLNLPSMAPARPEAPNAQQTATSSGAQARPEPRRASSRYARYSRYLWALAAGVLLTLAYPALRSDRPLAMLRAEAAAIAEHAVRALRGRGAAPQADHEHERAQAAAPHPAPAGKQPMTPEAALDQIFAARDPWHEVTVTVPRPEVRIGRDSLRMTIASSRPGFVYLFMVGSNGSDFSLLFPNALDRNNWITPARALELPRRGWDLQAAGPAGVDRFVAIVSETRRHFRDVGMQQADLFAIFPPEVVRRAAPAPGGATPVFAGKPDCAELIGPCPTTFGAAQFSIAEVAQP